MAWLGSLTLASALSLTLTSETPEAAQAAQLEVSPERDPARAPEAPPAPPVSPVPKAKETALPYAAWTSARHPLPTSELPDRAPRPAPEEPEQARRLLEFAPDVGVALPSCAGRGAACADLTAGAEVGLSALYRAMPHFAFGVVARLDAFSFGQGAADAAAAQMTFFGVAGRLYAFQTGLLDPYLELAIGGGSVETTVTSAGNRSTTVAEFTPAGRISAGVDFALNPWLRLGPAASLSEYAPSSASHCADRRCNVVDLGQAPVPRGATSFAFRLTFTTGERL